MTVNMTIEQEIVADKECRKSIDAIIQNVKLMPPTAERTLAYRKLQEGVMWLGMDLKRIGEITGTAGPYPDGKNPENLRINPTADGLKL